MLLLYKNVKTWQAISWAGWVVTLLNVLHTCIHSAGHLFSLSSFFLWCLGSFPSKWLTLQRLYKCHFKLQRYSRCVWKEKWSHVSAVSPSRKDLRWIICCNFVVWGFVRVTVCAYPHGHLSGQWKQWNSPVIVATGGRVNWNVGVHRKCDYVWGAEDLVSRCAVCTGKQPRTLYWQR